MTRILFVDDDAFMLAAMRRMLRRARHDWEVDFANSGAAALELMKTRSFDIIVSDMRMPEMTGCELLTHIKQQFPDVGRIVLSGQTDLLPEEDRHVAHAWLPKPCDPDSLNDAIKNVRARASEEALP